MKHPLRFAAVLIAFAWIVAPLQAQEPVLAVAPGVLLLPTSGVALDARNGNLRWRLQTSSTLLRRDVFSDGARLLIVSEAGGQIPVIHTPLIRLRRINPRTGGQLWSRLLPRPEEMALDARVRLFYILSDGHLLVINVHNGGKLASLHTPFWARGPLLLLPEGGVEMLSSNGDRSRICQWRPGTKKVQLASYEQPLLPVRGSGGNVLYAPRQGEYLAPGSLHPLMRESGAAFPRVDISSAGFAFTDQAGGRDLLRGATFTGQAWSFSGFTAPIHSLLTTGRAALALAWNMLTPSHAEHKLSGPYATQVVAVHLDSGKPMFSQQVPFRVNRTVGDRSSWILFGDSQLRAIDAQSGKTLWNAHGSYTPAVLTSKQLVVWDDGALQAFNRENGDRLWRDRLVRGPEARSKWHWH